MSLSLSLSLFSLSYSLSIFPGDALISALKVLLQDSTFAGGRSLEDKRAAAQVLVDRIMQKHQGLEGTVPTWYHTLPYFIFYFIFEIFSYIFFSSPCYSFSFFVWIYQSTHYDTSCYTLSPLVPLLSPPLSSSVSFSLILYSFPLFSSFSPSFSPTLSSSTSFSFSYYITLHLHFYHYDYLPFLIFFTR